MKAERRHELEHNELDHLMQNVAQLLREHGALIGIVLAAVALATLTYFLVLREQPIDAAAGKWNDYFYALSDTDSVEELESFIDKEKSSTEPPVLWAKLALADKLLAKASQQLFENRNDAEKSLEQAEENYLAVEKTARVPELRDRARIGLAEVYESQNKPEDAIKYYEMVLKSSPDSAWGKIAARGQKRLSEENTKEFLAWFAEQEPIKRSRPGTGMTPFDLPGLPTNPDFSVPPPLDSGEKPITPGLKLPGTELPPETTPPARPTPSDAEPKDDSSDAPAPNEKAEPSADSAPKEEPSSDESAKEKPQ